MAGKHTIHEREQEAVQLPGRAHKMIISPDHFGPSRYMAFGVADFPARKHAPGHVHLQEEEILYVLSGHGAIYFNGEPEEIEPGTCIYVPPGIEHSIENVGDSVLKVVYVFSPAVKQGSYDRGQS
ncbi:MAG: cupin domain-containing protein [Anaerolineales bacterium]|nr:cupin domain-containing protein [Anaerolineales bacterium]